MIKFIEKPTQADFEYVKFLTQRSFTGAEIPPDTKLLEAIMTGRLFIAKLPDCQPLGYGILTERYGAPWLFSMAVEPSVRKCLFGTHLLRAMTNDAYDRGFRVMGLSVKKDNIGAQILYLKFGFEVDLVIRNYYVDADGLLMRKRWK